MRKECVVTGSEFAAAMGLNPYCSRAKLVKQKIGLLPRDEVNEYVQFGTDSEPYVAKAYDSAFACNSRTFGFVTYERDGVKVGCSPDRVADGRLIEIKCSYRERYSVEPYHLPQLLAQTVMMGVPVVDYVTWAPSQVDSRGCMTLNVARVSFDPSLWEKHVWPALVYFKSLVDRKLTTRVNTAEKKELSDAFTRLTSIENPFTR